MYSLPDTTLSLLLITAMALTVGCTTNKQRKIRLSLDTNEPSFFSVSIPTGIEPEPATLKDEDYSRVSGEYAYVDLKRLLKLIGFAEKGGMEVNRIVFFEGVAASVYIGTITTTVYLCTKDIYGDWHIVGRYFMVASNQPSDRTDFTVESFSRRLVSG